MQSQRSGKSALFRRGLIGGTLLLGSILAAALFGALNIGIGQHGTSTAKGMTFLDNVLSGGLRVPEGKTLYLRTEVYIRYGPKAADVLDRNGNFPESTVSELWSQIGPDQTQIRYFGRATDASSGEVLQETSFEPELAFTKDSRTRAVLSSRVPSGPSKLNAAAERSVLFRSLLQDGLMTVLAQSASQIVFELREDIEPVVDSSGYSLPYIVDLNAVERVTTITLASDGVVLESTIHVLTESGQSVLVSSRRTTVVDVLDTFPAGLN